MDLNSLNNLTGITAEAVSKASTGGMFSGPTLIVSFIVSTIGLSYFIYGKKNGNTSSLIVGILLMGFPYFVYNVKYMIIIALILCILPFFVSI